MSSNLCPDCGAILINHGGCWYCRNCGYESCEGEVNKILKFYVQEIEEQGVL